MSATFAHGLDTCQLQPQSLHHDAAGPAPAAPHHHNGTFEGIFAALIANQFLHAMLVPCILGGCMYCVRTLVNWIVYSCVLPNLHSHVSIPSSESDCFDAVLQHLQQYQRREPSHLVVASMQDDPRSASTWMICAKSGDMPEITYRPASNGTPSQLSYRGYTVYVSRSKGETVTVGYHRRVMQLETLTLRVLGPHNAKVLKQFVDEAVHAANRMDMVHVYHVESSGSGQWRKVASRPQRPLHTVIVEGVAATLLQDAKEFLSKREWYKAMSIPFRRGYLLHGPPGSGKTSLCMALASALHMDLCQISMTGMNDAAFQKLMRAIPRRAAVLMEDVDALFVKRQGSVPRGMVTMTDGDSMFSSPVNVSFSGLLNALDGIAAPDHGYILFMTTNHPEVLDPALVRPGRVDVDVPIGNASKGQMRAMFLRFFPGEDALADRFSEALPEGELSMAQLQQRLQRCHGKGGAEEAAREAAAYVVVA